MQEPMSLLTKILHKEPVFPKPERVFWWWESICNLRCDHCDIGKKTMLAKFRPTLTLDKKKEVIKKVSEWIGKPYSLSFIAGEPFLHQDMMDILSYASQLGAKTSVTSNGTLIATPYQAKKVVMSGLNFIAISLDSISPKFHNQSRGKPLVWEQAVKAIFSLQKMKKILKKPHPIIYVNSIIMKDNLDDLIALVRWVKKNHIDGITFQPIATTDFFEGSTNEGSFWYKTSPLWPDTSKVLRFVDRLEKMKQEGYPIQNSKKDFEGFRLYFKDPVAFGKAEPCMGELKSMMITHDGFVRMCPESFENFGHVLRQNLDELWSSQQAARARKHIYECESQCKILANNKENFYF